MTQTNLLEFAKQGDPDAIAELMNLALQPKGVTAETQIKERCLHVVLSSARILNQQTLVGFTRKGLANLGLESIRSVKVYGKKIGEDLPIWTEEFDIASAEDSAHLNTAATAHAPESGQPTLHSVTEVLDSSFSNHKPDIKIVAPKVHLNRLHTTSNRLVPRIQSRLSRLLTATERVTAKIPLPKGMFPSRVRPSRFLAALTLITLPAFLLGVTVAVVAALTEGSSKRLGALLPTSASETQGSIQADVEQDILKQQTEAKKYLETMNKAQQDFYAKNNRFATSLEDLERSASVISQSYNYTYKLTLAGNNQSQLAAIPKAKGLKSFTGIVFVVPSEPGTDTATAAICESRLPSMIPPRLSSLAENQVQCPPGASKVSS
jgi:hypothetical protein